MRKSVFAVIALTMALLTGCNGCASFGENQATAKLATQYATLKVINGDVARADRIEEIVSQTLDGLEGGSATVAVIEALVRSRVDWSRLDPADTLLANALIDAVAAELEARVGTGVLDGERVVQVRAVLEWVIEAAELV